MGQHNIDCNSTRRSSPLPCVMATETADKPQLPPGRAATICKPLHLNLNRRCSTLPQVGSRFFCKLRPVWLGREVSLNSFRLKKNIFYFVAHYAYFSSMSRLCLQLILYILNINVTCKLVILYFEDSTFGVIISWSKWGR